MHVGKCRQKGAWNINAGVMLRRKSGVTFLVTILRAIAYDK